MRGESKSTAHGMRFVNFDILWGGAYFICGLVASSGRLALRSKRGQRSKHLRLTVKSRAFFDLQNRGLNRAFHDRGSLNFNSLGRKDVSVKLPGNDDDIGFDLPIYLSFVANDQNVGGKDFSFERAINTRRAFKLESAF